MESKMHMVSAATNGVANSTESSNAAGMDGFSCVDSLL